LAVWFILLICSTASSDSSGLHILSRCLAEAVSSVTIEQSSQWNAAIYNISSGDCTIQWIARNSEIGVIKYWSQCRLSLAEQLPLLEKICGEFFSKDRNAQAFRTLFWGRLAPDETRHGLQEMSLRLALAAHKSPGWDAQRGRPKNGDINGFVRDLSNRAMIYPELKELFARFHKSVVFSCAEKVLVQKAGKLPFYDQLKQQGVKAADKLPFDCMAWFSVSAVLQK
jgi:hypothetical protein